MANLNAVVRVQSYRDVTSFFHAHLPKASATVPMPPNIPRKTRNPFAMFSKAAPPDSETRSITSANDIDFPVTPSTPTANGTKTLQIFDRQSHKDVVSNLRRLREHHKLPHAGYIAGPGSYSPEYKKYFDLCKKLLDFASWGTYSIRHYALNETINLAVEDTFLRSVLADVRSIYHSLDHNRGGPDSIALEKLIQRARFTIKPSNSIHKLWSGLIRRLFPLRNSQWKKVEEFVLPHCDPLKSSLIDPDTSFLAARYLNHTLRANLVGNHLYCLADIWHCYMDVAASQPEAIEWTTFDDCIKYLHSSHIHFTSFVSPTRLARLAKALLQAADDLPNLFSIIFGFPRIDYEVTSSNIDLGPDETTIFKFTRVHGDNLNFLPLFVPLFIQSLNDAEGIVYTRVHGKFEFEFLPLNSPEFVQFLDDSQYSDATGLKTILNTDDRARNALRNTVLVSANWRHYCAMIGELFINNTMAFLPEAFHRESNIARGILFLSSTLNNRALAAFFLARFSGIDRYCKRSISNLRLDGREVQIPMSLVDNVRDLVGPYSRTRIPHFDNVPYLRRFRLGAEVFITSDSLPEPPHSLIASSANNSLSKFSVDSMVIDGDMVVWLDVGAPLGWEFADEGHYPILAGYDERGAPLYVAAIKHKFVCYFTCVKNGTWTAKYTDEVGDTHESKEFFVLALRHDPSDLKPPYPRIPGGALDQTGPLYWLTFWPKKDPDYCAASDSAKSDDSHLESLLDSYDGKSDLWMWG